MATPKFYLVAWTVIDASPMKVRHARINTAPDTLCGQLIPPDATVIESRGGLRCASCLTGVERLATVEGQIAFIACGTTLVSNDAWKVACYAADERSKLATVLADAADRVAALYKPPQAE